MAVAGQNALIVGGLLEHFDKLAMRRLESPGHRERGGELDLVRQIVGLCFSQLFVFSQRLIKSLMPRQRRHVIGPRYMKLRRQFQAALKQQYCLANRTNRDSHLCQQSNRVDIMGTPFEICLLYTSPSPRDKRQSRMPSSA